jgi:RHS repeat-associated protein
VGGAFQVDVQLAGVQEVDGVGGVTVGLASGEVGFSWASQAMTSPAGSVGFGVRYAPSNPPEVGVPAGWSLQAASSSQYRRIEMAPDGGIALVANNGIVTNYRPGADGVLEPVRLTGAIDAAGSAPVVIANGDGTYSVTTKEMVSVFAATSGSDVAYLVDVSANGRPVLRHDWTGGVLRSITDPVSGRAVMFHYGGGDCLAPPGGFSPAPQNLLCGVQFWDGSRAALFYVTTPTGEVTIGRLVAYPEAGLGAEVTDLAFDGAGRLSRVRMPLVAQAAAAGVIDPDDAQFWSDVVYDDRGRVVSVTEAAPAHGAQRCTRSYGYVAVGTTTVSDSCMGIQVAEVQFDPTTFFTLRKTNGAGQRAEFRWDLATGHLLEQTDAQGLSTRYRYEGGRLVETVGPSRVSTAQVTSRLYDQAGDGSAMVGLDVTYWASPTDRSDPARQELGPMIDGIAVPSLTVNWPSSPTGADGGWSALMTGGVEIDTPGVYRFVSKTPGVVLRVNNVLCTDTTCDAVPLAAGVASLRIDITAAQSAASMDIVWSGPDTGGVEQSVPAERLRPLYGFATTTTVLDADVVNTVAENVSFTRYDNPALGQVSARSTQAGATTTLEYEADAWHRQTASVSPGGQRTTFTYWGDREVATPPCEGATPTPQAGGAKTVTVPGGLTTQQWYDTAGRLIASRLADGPVTCTRFDNAGRVAEATIEGAGRVERSVNDYAVGGNPLVSRTTSTVGDDTLIVEVTTDLAGRPVRAVDVHGVVVDTVYDPRTGEIASTTSTAPGAAATTLSYSYDQRGWLTSVSHNGRELAAVTYRADGTTDRITYGSGVTLGTGFDDALRLNRMAWTTPTGGRFDVTRRISVAGHASQATYTVDGVTSQFDYVNDAAGRLISTTLTAGLTAARTWAYTYDADSNRLSSTIDGVTHTNTYDANGRLTATTDPVGAGGITYDTRGNITQLGDLTLTYDTNNRLATASDGTSTVTYRRNIDGSIVTRGVQSPDGVDVVSFAASGITLNGDGAAIAQRVDLPGGASYTWFYNPATTPEWAYSSINADQFFRTDDTGTPVGAPQMYDPFGVTLTTPDAATPGTARLTWQSVMGNETFDLTTPVVMMGARLYVPALGRFVQIDPKIGGSANLYDFANQNPVNAADPSGESILDYLPTIVVGVAAAAAAILLPPAAGFMVGAAIGALVGGLGYLATWGLNQAFGLDSHFSYTQLGISMGVGALLGGISGRVQWNKALKNSESLLGTRIIKPNTFGIARNAKDVNRAASLLRKFEAGVNVKAPQYAKQLAAVERLYVKLPNDVIGSSASRNMHLMLTDPIRYTVSSGRSSVSSALSKSTEEFLARMSDHVR